MILAYTLSGILFTSTCITGFLLSKATREKRLLTKTKTLYEAVFRNINAFIILIDEDFFVKMINYQAGKTFAPKQPTRVGEFLLCKNGIDSGECGKHGWCKKCLVRTSVTQTLQTGKEFAELEVPMRVYQDEERTQHMEAYFSISGKIFSAHGKRHVLLTVYNVTPQKNKQHRLQQEKQQIQQSDQLKSAFLMNLCRELKLPTTAITGVYKMQPHTELVDKPQELNELINNQEALQRLVSQVVDLSNIETGAMKFVYSPVNINDLLGTLEENHQTNPAILHNVQVLFRPELKKCEIITDPERLLQLLDNLLHNAIHTTLQGEITVGYTIRESDIYFYVRDSGPYIPAEEQLRIFNRFTKFREKKPDVGLRLSVSKVIAEKLQGEIGVYSKKDEGSTFWFTLPVQPL